MILTPSRWKNPESLLATAAIKYNTIQYNTTQGKTGQYNTRQKFNLCMARLKLNIASVVKMLNIIQTLNVKNI